MSVIDLLMNAKRPLLHVGHGVRIAKALPELFKFLENAKIPVVTARNGIDLIPSDHPMYIGRPGTFAQRGANFAVQLCDVYLAVGTRLCLSQTGYNPKDYARNAKVIQVDIDGPELNKNTVPVHLKIHADAKDFLTSMALVDGWPDWTGWWLRCKSLQAKYPPVTDEQRNQRDFVNSYALIERLSELAGHDDVIVTDMGFAFQNTAQAWSIKRGQRLIQNGGTAAMGWGLPAAIGAAIGSSRRVILIAGDGGLMMNIQELSTLAHHKLNVKIFLLNNSGYLTMRQSQEYAYGHSFGSGEKDLSFPNFAALSRAFGIPSVTKYNLDVEGVLKSDGPVLCEVMMDPNQEQIPKAINRRLEDGTIKQTAIEDSYPFLPEEELRENLTA
jgi:acetolactate synthase-1/2/3 large subunit